MYKIKNTIKKIFYIFEKNNFQAYLVGGYVRDMLMNKKNTDIDITTDATPEQILNIFHDYKTIQTGIKYGTIVVKIDDIFAEITTFRSDNNYADGRHPQNIIFEKDIKKDLARRDFTINAIAYNEKEGIVDIFDGMGDIKNKLIRCVGESEKKFDEDKLRMLRAIRFASTLDFDIEKNTFNSIKKLSNKINKVSKERINAELNKILLSKKSSKAINIMYQTRMLEQIFPIENIDEITDIIDKSSPIIEIRLAIILYSEKKYAKEILQNLRYSKKITNNVLLLIKNTVDANTGDKEIRKMIYNIGTENFARILEINRLFSIAKNKKTIPKEKIQKIMSENPITDKKQLAIQAKDLITLGYTGKNISYLLDMALQTVFENPSSNTRDTLLNMVIYEKRKY